MRLIDRINDRREANDNIVPIQERRGGTERRVPTWIRRMQDGDLKAKDMTERAA